MEGFVDIGTKMGLSGKDLVEFVEKKEKEKNDREEKKRKKRMIERKEIRKEN